MRLQCLVSHSLCCLFLLELLSGVDLPSCQMVPYSLLTSCSSVSLNVSWTQRNAYSLICLITTPDKKSRAHLIVLIKCYGRKGMNAGRNKITLFCTTSPFLSEEVSSVVAGWAEGLNCPLGPDSRVVLIISVKGCHYEDLCSAMLGADITFSSPHVPQAGHFCFYKTT